MSKPNSMPQVAPAMTLSNRGRVGPRATQLTICNNTVRRAGAAITRWSIPTSTLLGQQCTINMILCLIDPIARPVTTILEVSLTHVLSVVKLSVQSVSNLDWVIASSSQPYHSAHAPRQASRNHASYFQVDPLLLEDDHTRANGIDENRQPSSENGANYDASQHFHTRFL